MSLSASGGSVLGLAAKVRSLAFHAKEAFFGLTGFPAPSSVEEAAERAILLLNESRTNGNPALTRIVAQYVNYLRANLVPYTPGRVRGGILIPRSAIGGVHGNYAGKGMKILDKGVAQAEADVIVRFEALRREALDRRRVFATRGRELTLEERITGNVDGKYHGNMFAANVSGLLAWGDVGNRSVYFCEIGPNSIDVFLSKIKPQLSELDQKKTTERAVYEVFKGLVDHTAFMIAQQPVPPYEDGFASAERARMVNNTVNAFLNIAKTWQVDISDLIDDITVGAAKLYTHLILDTNTLRSRRDAKPSNYLSEGDPFTLSGVPGDERYRRNLERALFGVDFVTMNQAVPWEEDMWRLLMDAGNYIEHDQLRKLRVRFWAALRLFQNPQDSERDGTLQIFNHSGDYDVSPEVSESHPLYRSYISAYGDHSSVKRFETQARLLYNTLTIHVDAASERYRNPDERAFQIGGLRNEALGIMSGMGTFLRSSGLYRKGQPESGLMAAIREIEATVASAHSRSLVFPGSSPH